MSGIPLVLGLVTRFLACTTQKKARLYGCWRKSGLVYIQTERFQRSGQTGFRVHSYIMVYPTIPTVLRVLEYAAVIKMNVEHMVGSTVW